MSHVRIGTVGEQPQDDDAGHLVLDAAAWAELCTLVPGVVVPEDFTTSWEDIADADTLRGPARARLETAGLVDSDDTPHPGLTALLDRLGAAPVRIRVRSSAGDRVVLAHLATGWDTTVTLTRVQRITTDDVAASSAPRHEDGAAVDVAAYPTTELADRLWHLLPPALTQRSTTGNAAAVEVAWEDAIALLQALRQAPAWPVAVRGEVLADLLAQAGLDNLPDVLPSLAPLLAGAVEISVVLLPGTPAQRQWQGLWLLTGDGRVVAVAQPHQPRTEAKQGDDAQPAPRVRLLDVDADTVRADILRSLAGVLDELAAILTARGEQNREDGDD